MKFDEIESTDLNDKERQHIQQLEQGWATLGSGSHLDDWLKLIPGLAVGRRIAMRAANTNRPKGRGYSEAFAAWQDRHCRGLDKTSITALLWLDDTPGALDALTELRRELTPGQRARLASPITARQRVEKRLKEKASTPEPQGKAPPLRERVAELETENAALRKKLAESDGSLFDLKRDTPAQIAQVLVGTVASQRVEAIIKAVRAELKKRSAPAG